MRREITCIGDILAVLDDYFMPPKYKHRLSTYINFSCEKGEGHIRSSENRRSTVLKNYPIEPSNYIVMGFSKVPNEDNCKFKKVSATGYYLDRAEQMGLSEDVAYLEIPDIRMCIDWVKTRHDVCKTTVWYEHLGLKYCFVYDINAGCFLK